LLFKFERMPAWALLLPAVAGGGRRAEVEPLLVDTVGLKVTLRCGLAGGGGVCEEDMLDFFDIRGVNSVAVDVEAIVD
jgi:hypothetical protein